MHTKTGTSWASAGHLPGFNPLWRSLVHHLVPFMRNANGAQGIFRTAGHMWSMVLHLVPTMKKGHVSYLNERGVLNKYQVEMAVRDRETKTDKGLLSLTPYLLNPNCDCIFRAPLSTASVFQQGRGYHSLGHSLSVLQIWANLCHICLQISCHYIIFSLLTHFLLVLNSHNLFLLSPCLS